MKARIYGTASALGALMVSMLGPGMAVDAAPNTRIAALPKVTVTLLVDNCDSCIITAFHTPNWQQDGMFTRKATVRGGRLRSPFRSGRPWGCPST